MEKRKSRGWRRHWLACMRPAAEAVDPWLQSAVLLTPEPQTSETDVCATLQVAKGPGAVMRMSQESNRHACATRNRGWGKVKGLDVSGQLPDRRELQGLEAEGPGRFHILRAIVNEKTFFRS